MKTILRHDSLNNTISVTLQDLTVNFFQEQFRLEVCRIAAEKYVKENYNEIIKGIDPVAISNMTIAQAGAKVNETLNKKMPDKVIVEHHDYNPDRRMRGF